MKIRLLNLCHRVPTWIQTGFQEYAKRLPKECALEMVDIPPIARQKNSNLEKIKNEEGEKLLSRVKSGRIITLDEHGTLCTTEKLSKHLKEWLAAGQPIHLLVGGPDGLSKECLQKAEWSWSLSPLTLPHQFIRLLVAEQLYRAWTILKNHPYHRA